MGSVNHDVNVVALGAMRSLWGTNEAFKKRCNSQSYILEYETLTPPKRPVFTRSLCMESTILYMKELPQQGG